MNTSLHFYVAWMDIVRQLPPPSGSRRSPSDRQRLTRGVAIAAAQTTEQPPEARSRLARILRLGTPAKPTTLILTTERTPTR